MNDIIKGMGVHHIALKCKDMDESIRFYTSIGCVVQASWGTGLNRGALLDTGDGCYIEIFNGGGEEKTESDTLCGEWFHIALTCDDPDAAFAAAIAAGAKEKVAPFDTVLRSESPIPIRIAFVYGPDKEVIEFFHVKGEK